MGPAGALLIGEGESAEVFAHGDGRVLKLLRRHVLPAIADREFAATALARAIGIRAARPVEIVRVDGRVGMVSERLDGPVLLRLVGRRPVGMTIAIVRLALWLAALHRTPVAATDLPPLRERLAARIGRSTAGPAAIAAARAALATLPDGDRLCHGDLHMGNVIVTRDGWAAIDWAKATVGAGAADAARSELLIRYGGLGATMQRFALLRIVRHLSAEFFLNCYCLASRTSRREVAGWRLPVAVAWMHGQRTIYLPGLQRLIDRMVARSRSA